MIDSTTMRFHFRIQCIGERKEGKNDGLCVLTRTLEAVTLRGFRVSECVCVLIFLRNFSTRTKTATNKRGFVLNFKKAFIQYFGR